MTNFRAVGFSIFSLALSPNKIQNGYKENELNLKPGRILTMT